MVESRPAPFGEAISRRAHDRFTPAAATFRAPPPARVSRCAPVTSLPDDSETFSCVVFALAREATPFLRSFRNVRRIDAPFRVWHAANSGALQGNQPRKSFHIVQTGVGRASIETVLDWLCSVARLPGGIYRPSFVLSAGFSGSLGPGLAVGDLVLATEVLSATGERWTTSWPGGELTNTLPPRIRRGPILALDELIGDPAHKRSLGTAHSALAVDMETAAVAQYCSRRDVPFGSLRVISDPVEQALSPRLVKLLSQGRVSPIAVAKALAREPALLAEFWRLARDTRRAARILAGALHQLLAS